MRAAVYREFGAAGNVKITDVPTPKPKAGEILVRVVASSVDVADVRIRALRVPGGLSFLTRLAMGPIKPKYPILGTQFAGVVEAVGDGVNQYKPGDEVVGTTGGKFGCHAEYVCVQADGALAAKPQNLSFEEAVSVLFGGATALAYLDLAEVKKGDKVLINGASGAVGVAAVQLAAHLGAQISAVCSGKNAELVTRLGARRVIDHTKADFKSAGEQFDFIMDNVGNAPFSEIEDILAPQGKLLVVIFKNAGEMIKNIFNKRALLLAGKDEQMTMSAQMYTRLMGLAQEGVLKPVIDQTYTLDHIVAAHNHVDTGRKVGAVVVKIS